MSKLLVILITLLSINIISQIKPIFPFDDNKNDLKDLFPELKTVKSQGCQNPSILSDFETNSKLYEHWINYTDGHVITSFAEDHDYLWIGTIGNLAKLNKITGEKTLFNKTDGLPSNMITGIVIDSLKNIWVSSNDGGLAKYDGNIWVTYNTLNSPLPSDELSCLAIDQSGNLWIGTFGSGLIKYNFYDWLNYNTWNSGISSDNIRTIAVDGYNNIWCGSTERDPLSGGNGISKFNGTTWTNFNSSNSNIQSDIIYHIHIDANNIKWLSTYGSGLIMFDDTTFTNYNTSNSSFPFTYVWCSETDKNGNLWVGGWGGCAMYDNSNWTIYNTGNSEIPGDYVWAIISDNQNKMWFGTEHNLVSLHNNNWENFNVSNSGLYGVNFITLITNAGTTKWFGNWGWGLTSYNSNQWYNYLTNQDDYAIMSLTRGIDNTLWVCSGNPYFAYFHLSKFNPPSLQSMVDADVWSGAIEDSTMWFGSYTGVYKYDGVNWYNYNTSNSNIPNNYAWAVNVDNLGRKWIGTRGSGLAIYDDNNWLIYNTSNSGLSCDVIKSIKFDDNNSVWLASWGSGLINFDGLNWTTYSTSNSGIPSDYVNAIDFDNQGNIWIGTFSGVAKFDGTQWTTFDRYNSGLPNDEVWDIQFDQSNNLWMATYGGGIAVYLLSETSSSEEISNTPIPQDFQLQQKFPNPYNPTTTIGYSLPNEGFIKLEVFDILGRRITTLADEYQSAGKYEKSFDASLLTSGVYIYRLQADGFTQTKKMILLK